MQNARASFAVQWALKRVWSNRKTIRERGGRGVSLNVKVKVIQERRKFHCESHSKEVSLIVKVSHENVSMHCGS